MRAAKVQASLRICAVSPEPSLLAHTSSESRGTFRQKARSLAPLNGLACAVKICHDGMLEDTNSLDGAQLVSVADQAGLSVTGSQSPSMMWLIFHHLVLLEPQHEKTFLCHRPYVNNKGADQPVRMHRLSSAFVVLCLDRIIPLVSISKLSSLYLASVAGQADLSLPLLQTPKTGFLMTRLILS